MSKVISPGESRVAGKDVASSIDSLQDQIDKLKAGQAKAAALGASGGTSVATFDPTRLPTLVRNETPINPDPVQAAQDAQDANVGVVNVDLLSVGAGDARYAFKKHIHPGLLTVAEQAAIKAATGGLSATNRVLSSQDLIGANPLLAKLLHGYTYYGGIKTGFTNSVDLRAIIGNETVAFAPTDRGIIPNESAFVRDSLSWFPVTVNGYAVHALAVPLSLISRRQPPTNNVVTLAKDYIALDRTFIVDRVGVLANLGKFFVVVNNAVFIGIVIFAGGTAIQINPPGIVTNLLTGTKIYAPLAGEALIHSNVATGSGNWSVGSFGGEVVVKSTSIFESLMPPGTAIVINPGGLNEELRTVDTLFTSNIEPSNGNRGTLRCTTTLSSSHTPGEPVVLLSLVTDNPNQPFLLEFKIRNIDGNFLDFDTDGRDIDVLIPRRFNLQEFPIDNLNTIARFFHLIATGTGGGGGGNVPTQLGANTAQFLTVQFGAFTFQGVVGVTVTHSLSLQSYAVTVTPNFNASLATVGNFGEVPVQHLADQFQIKNTGNLNLVTGNYMIYAIPPVVRSPLVASGIDNFVLGTLVKSIAHNKNLASYFILIDLMGSGTVAAVGVVGVRSITPNTFEVKHTGSSATAQFRWSIFDTSTVPVSLTRVASRTDAALAYVDGTKTISAPSASFNAERVVSGDYWEYTDGTLKHLVISKVISSFQVQVYSATPIEGGAAFTDAIKTYAVVARGKLLATGTATFAGSAGTRTITHNMNFTAYHVAITPLVGSGLAAVGAYGTQNKLLNTFEVKNTGTDATTQFMWALFGL